MKLPPASTYASSTASEAFWSVVHPNVLPPRHSADTLSPVRPSLRISMTSLLFPELSGREPRALGHRLELLPDDLGLDQRLRARERGEAAVAARHHPLASHHLRVANETLRDELGVLDEVGGGVEHARDDHLVVGQLDLAEHDPLVRVARVGALEGERLRPRLQHHRQDLAQ